MSHLKILYLQVIYIIQMLSFHSFSLFMILLQRKQQSKQK